MGDFLFWANSKMNFKKITCISVRRFYLLLGMSASGLQVELFFSQSASILLGESQWDLHDSYSIQIVCKGMEMKIQSDKNCQKKNS